jgi:hypothetical protein
VKKTDTVRKGYKRETAIKRERQLLNTIAIDLYEKFPFKTAYDTPNFGDVMNATDFYSHRDFRKYFRDKENKKALADPLKDKLDQNEWIFLINLNYRVNTELHIGLIESDDTLEIVMENDVCDKVGNEFDKKVSIGY